MTTRGGDPAAKDKSPVAIEHESVARGLRAETRGFHSILVGQNRHAGNRRRASAQVGVVPVRTSALRLHEKDIGIRLAEGVRHDLRQLANACASAGTMRMGQHQQRGLVRLARDD